MKKLLVTLAAAAALAGSAFGQGQVTMANNSGSLVTYLGNPVAVGSTSFQLTYGNASGANGSLTAIGPVAGVNVNAAGRIANTTLAANALTANTSYWFQILAWQGASATYGAAVLAGNVATGFSTQFQATTSANNTSLPTSLAGLYPGFAVVNPSPEPTTLALLGVGAASLLAFRRRKA